MFLLRSPFPSAGTHPASSDRNPISEYSVSLLNLIHPLFFHRIIPHYIRMVLFRKLPISGLDLFFGGAGSDPQHLIVIRHIAILPAFCPVIPNGLPQNVFLSACSVRFIPFKCQACRQSFASRQPCLHFYTLYPPSTATCAILSFFCLMIRVKVPTPSASP